MYLHGPFLKEEHENIFFKNLVFCFSLKKYPVNTYLVVKHGDAYLCIVTVQKGQTFRDRLRRNFTKLLHLVSQY